MPGGIPLLICRVCDLSNFMVSKCNFLQLKGLLEGWMEGKCCLPRAWGWVRRAGESSLVTVTIICGCSYDTLPDYAFWTNSIWSFVVGKTFYRWSHNKRTSALMAIWRWLNLNPLLQNDRSDSATPPKAHVYRTKTPTLPVLLLFWEPESVNCSDWVSTLKQELTQWL